MDAYWVDAALHILLGIVYTLAVVSILRLFTGNWTIDASIIIAVLFLYIREVTQHQTAHYESNIFRGWLPWGEDSLWSLGKTIETFVPMTILLSVVFIRRVQLTLVRAAGET